jgi:putative ABC transport system permease protein
MPLIITLSKKEFLRELGIRYREGTKKQVEKSINNLWKELFGESSPEYESFEESIQSEYTKEAQLLKILNVFTFLVVFISAMGLFALSLLVLRKRSKEIAIRKVNGATNIEIFLDISIEFFRLAFIAMIFAWPIGWYIIHRWLENFAYHKNIGVLIFLFSGLITIIIIQVSILMHAFLAAKTNLATTLKNE